jgi:maltose alpha-D-glucosyltransferase/alpha-amylase
MGDDLSLPEREAARTPMQWTAEHHGGFSRADEVVRPVIADDPFGFERVNVADQRRDVDSLLNWQERMIRVRRECPEIGWGDYTLLPIQAATVLALRYDWRNVSLITLHNFSAERVAIVLELTDADKLVNVLQNATIESDGDGRFRIPLEGYGYRWLRVGSVDSVLDRSEF